MTDSEMKTMTKKLAEFRDQVDQALRAFEKEMTEMRATVAASVTLGNGPARVVWQKRCNGRFALEHECRGFQTMVCAATWPVRCEVYKHLDALRTAIFHTVRDEYEKFDALLNPAAPDGNSHTTTPVPFFIDQLMAHYLQPDAPCTADEFVSCAVRICMGNQPVQDVLDGIKVPTLFRMVTKWIERYAAAVMFTTPAGEVQLIPSAATINIARWKSDR